MASGKVVIGGGLVIDGRILSLSRAIRAGDTVYLTGQIPMKDGVVMTTGDISEQTRAVLDVITNTLADAGCTRDHIVKTMVWLRDRADFPGFNAVYAEYFPENPPARSAVISELLVDCRVEIEVVAWQHLPAATVRCCPPWPRKLHFPALKPRPWWCWSTALV